VKLINYEMRYYKQAQDAYKAAEETEAKAAAQGLQKYVDVKGRVHFRRPGTQLPGEYAVQMAGGVRPVQAPAAQVPQGYYPWMYGRQGAPMNINLKLNAAEVQRLMQQGVYQGFQNLATAY